MGFGQANFFSLTLYRNQPPHGRKLTPNVPAKTNLCASSRTQFEQRTATQTVLQCITKSLRYFFFSLRLCKQVSISLFDYLVNFVNTRSVLFQSMLSNATNAMVRTTCAQQDCQETKSNAQNQRNTATKVGQVNTYVIYYGILKSFSM